MLFRSDPAGLVSYVNYPSTEYLELPFLDLVCFDVYLESQDRLEGYLQRLQNLAGDRPLVMSEIGLDSFRNGEDVQARALDWQIRTTFAGGCAGAFVFSWTDEWFRAGAEVEDWAFGLTTESGAPSRPWPPCAAPSRRYRSRRAGGGLASRSSCAAITARAPFGPASTGCSDSSILISR